MLRRFSTFVLIVAALIAVEPLLHHHPLEQRHIPSSCAICATGVGRLPVMTPAVAAPQIVAYTLIAAVVRLHVVTIAPSLPSRAPPSA